MEMKMVLSRSNPSHHGGDGDLGKLLRFTPSEERMREQRKLQQRQREAAALAMLLEREKEQFQRLLLTKHSNDILLLHDHPTPPKPGLPSTYVKLPPPIYFYDFFAPMDDDSRVHVLDTKPEPSSTTGETTRKRKSQQQPAHGHDDHDYEARRLRLLHPKSLQKPVIGLAEKHDLPQAGPSTPPHCDLFNVNLCSSSSEGKEQSGSNIITKNPLLAFVEGEGIKKNKKQKQQVMPPEHPAHPLLPEQLRAYIQQHGGLVSEAKLVIGKYLTATDVARGQSRLSLPVRNLVSSDFLTTAEKTLLNGRDKSHRPNAIDVPLLQLPANTLAQIKLKKWEMKKETSSSSSYVLCHTWNDVVSHNGLKEGSFIQIWSFRIGTDSTLYLAILRVQPQ